MKDSSSSCSLSCFLLPGEASCLCTRQKACSAFLERRGCVTAIHAERFCRIPEATTARPAASAYLGTRSLITAVYTGKLPHILKATTARPAAFAYLGARGCIASVYAGKLPHILKANTTLLSHSLSGEAWPCCSRPCRGALSRFHGNISQLPLLT
eukprot:1159128-Pelagomonas_calceolata.AAC.6